MYKGSKKAQDRAKRQKARADAFFIIYYSMGPERSLEKLCIYATELGLKKALTTLKRYSIQYYWQQRVIEEDTRKYNQDLTDSDNVRNETLNRQRHDLPPKNCTSYNVRKTKPVKRGDSGAKEDLYTGADYQQAARS